MDNESSSLTLADNSEAYSTQDEKYDYYKDVPDLIINVKQEILAEDVSLNANKGFTLKYRTPKALAPLYAPRTCPCGECILEDNSTTNDVKPKGIFKLQNIQKIVAHLKNSLKKNDETSDTRKKPFCTNENSNCIKKDPDRRKDSIQGSSEGFIKVEEVNIKSENEEADDSMSSRRLGQKQSDNSIVHICRYCPYPTDHLSQSGEVGTFRCEQCDFQTIYKDCFSTHLLRHEERDNMNKFKCLQCKYQTYKRRDLKKHVLTHKNYKNDMLKCTECYYQTVSSGHLEIHLQLHTNRPTLKCYHCDFGTIYKTWLIKHLDKHKYPENTDEFKCNECDYRTYKKINLYSHRLRHKNPKTTHFKCDYCNYKTLLKAALNKHLDQHDFLPKFRGLKCDKCGYRTFNKNAFKSHCLLHKYSKGAKKVTFKCAHCDFRTISRKSIRYHILGHRNPEQMNLSRIVVQYKKVKNNS